MSSGSWGVVLGIDFGRADRAALCLENGPVRLRLGEPRDAAAWVELRERSRSHLIRWEPDWRAADATVEAVRARLRTSARGRRDATYQSLFVFRRSDEKLVGGVTLSSIRRHASRSAQIGYWIGADHVRRGYARAAVGAVVRYVFEDMALNRLEAACQPANLPSRRVLAGAGFRQEGYARDYLFINGAWRDHCLYAMTAGDAVRLSCGESVVGREPAVANDRVAV